jgi:hypothetical protein
MVPRRTMTEVIMATDMTNPTKAVRKDGVATGSEVRSVCMVVAFGFN